MIYFIIYIQLFSFNLTWLNFFALCNFSIIIVFNGFKINGRIIETETWESNRGRNPDVHPATIRCGAIPDRWSTSAADPVAVVAVAVVVAAAAAAVVGAAAAAAGLSGPILWALRGMRICFRPELKAAPCGSEPLFRNPIHYCDETPMEYRFRRFRRFRFRPTPILWPLPPLD